MQFEIHASGDNQILTELFKICLANPLIHFEQRLLETTVKAIKSLKKSSNIVQSPRLIESERNRAETDMALAY